MAKFELTFCGVTDTLKPDGSKESSINITMSTGSEHKEGYCYYKVPWTKTALVRDPNDPRKSSSVKSEGSGTTCFALNLQNGRFTRRCTVRTRSMPRCRLPREPRIMNKKTVM